VNAIAPTQTHAANSRRIIRVFAASPGDVADERRRLAKVVDGLNERFEEHLGGRPELKEWRCQARSTKKHVRRWAFALVGALLFALRCSVPDCAAQVPSDKTAENEMPVWRWEAVVAALEDPSPEVQREAFDWLDNLDETDAVLPPASVQNSLGKVFKERLTLAQPDDAIVVQLGCLKWVSNAAAFAPQVAELLKSPSDAVRSSAADALARMGTNGAAFAPQVAELLKSQSHDAGRAAAAALARMGTNGAAFAPQVAELFKGLRNFVIPDVADALAQMDPNGVALAQQMAELLKSPLALPRDAAYALARMGTNGAAFAPQVAELLKSPSDYVRRDAAAALARMGSSGAAFAPQVAELLKSPSDYVRRDAAAALARMGPSGAAFAPQVADLLKISDEDAKQSAETALLALIRHPDARTALHLLDSSHSHQHLRGSLVFWAYLTGGADTTNRLRCRWLPSRETDKRLEPKGLVLTNAEAVLQLLSETYPLAERLQHIRSRCATLASDVVRTQRAKGPVASGSLLAHLGHEVSRQIQEEFPDQARAIEEALRPDKLRWWLWRGLGVAGGHALFWLLLIFAYPRWPLVQAVFFWNKWVRRMFGLGYVGLAITLVPWLRRRLFRPFQESLIPRRLLDGYAAAGYFDQTEVVEDTKARIPGGRRRLREAVPEVRGQVVLQGQSGLGKTLLLQQLAIESKRTLVFLRATSCADTGSADGVLAAIQKRLEGQARDATYLKTLIYAGALDVLIDGLNEASPEARVNISRFVEQNFKGNFVVTTQPMKWAMPDTARVFELQPLRPDQIEAFLRKQWAAVAPLASVSQESYERAVAEYVSVLPQETKPGTRADPRLLVLCNPMEAALAAELIAQGEKPDLFRLVEQRYEGMNEAFKERHGGDFPRESFSERVYDWRKVDRSDMDMKDFEVEAEELAEHRLMIQREDEVQTKSGVEKRSRWFFRHDRIMEFFLVPAFLGAEHKQRRLDQIEDERFWGVYELLAVQLPAAEERELYSFLNEWAASNNQNELRNRYELARRKRAADKG
jgi:HEAT repeat protein